MPRILDLKINREKATEDKDPVIDLENMKIGTLVRFRNGRRHQFRSINFYCADIFEISLSECKGPPYHRFLRDGHFANPKEGNWVDPLCRLCEGLSSHDYSGWDIVEVIKEP